MKKSILTITICGFTLLTGCQYGNHDAADDIYPENGNTINVTERNENFNPDRQYNGTEQSKNNFGYVRQQKSPIANDNEYDGPALDREQLANAISRLLITLPNVNDAATLVTDEEVLIAYDTPVTGDDERFEVADWVKKSAIAIAPRYYHLYVSDNKQHFNDIERFGQLSATTENVDSAIDQTIKDMISTSPQGRKLSSGENENGESYGEMNDNMNKDDLNQQNKGTNVNNMINR